MAERSIDKLTDALTAPLGDLIASVADGVAKAQTALDLQAIQTFKEIYASGEGLNVELQRMGYQPTWYKIPEVKAEIVMTLSIKEREIIQNLGQLSEEQQSTNAPLNIFAAPVDAYYANRYGYDIQGASKLKFSIVAVPPSPQAESMRVVPALIGKSFDEARELLDLLNINYSIKLLGGESITIEQLNARMAASSDTEPTSPKVISTDPKAGEILKPNVNVILVIQL